LKHQYSRAEFENYLLGHGSEEERARFAEELIADADFDALIREVEADKVDALARGELKGNDAEAWREFLASTGQLDRLRVAQALAERVRPRRPFRVWLQVAAAFLMMVSAAWWWTWREKPPVPLVAALRVNLDLPRDVTRSAGKEGQLQIAGKVGEVELRFAVAEEPASGYRLRMRNAAGNLLLEREGKGWPTGTLAIVVPAASFPQGMIELELLALGANGSESPVSFHRVRVVR